MATEKVIYLCFPLFEYVVFFELQYSNKSCKNLWKNTSFLMTDKLKFMNKCLEQPTVLKNNSAAFQGRNILALQYKNCSFISVLY